MPGLLEAPPAEDSNPFADLVGGDNGGPAYQTVGGVFGAVPKAEVNTPTDFGAFADLMPDPVTTGGRVAGADDLGTFHDLVPLSPTSESEKALAETSHKMREAETLAGRLTGMPFHEVANSVRVFGAAAGKYIFNGLQGWAMEQAKLAAHPTPEMVALPPEASLLPKDQQDALEKQYIAETQAGVPTYLAKAERIKHAQEAAQGATDIDPALADTIPARLSAAAGEATMMGVESLIPGAGLPLMTLHGALATEAEMKNNGATDEQVERAAVRSAIGLGLFGGASKVAALGVAALLPKGAAPLTRFVSQFVGQEAANESSSRAIAAWNEADRAPQGQKVQAALNALGEWNLESGTLNTVYALMHAAKATGAKRVGVSPEAKSEPEAPTSPASEPVPPTATTPGGTPETARYVAPAAEAVPAIQPEGGEINAVQKRSPAPEVPRAAETGQDQPVSREGVGRSEQGQEVARANQEEVRPIEPEGNDWTRATEEARPVTPEASPAQEPPVPVETHGMKLRERAGEAGYSDLIPDLIDFGGRVFKKGMTYAKWAGEMARHLGAKVKAHLKTIWDAIKSRGDERGGIGGLAGKGFGLKISGKRNDLNEATTKRSAKLQNSFADAERAQKEINRAVPSKRRQAAIAVNIEAAGDPVLLAHWEGAAKGKAFRQAAADAQTLTPGEAAIRDKAKQAFDVLGLRGQRNDAIGDQLRDNYVTHVWDVTKKFSGVGSSRLKDKFKFAKARSFSTLFDGDQAGFVPKTMAIGELLPGYMHELNTVIADKQFVRDISTGKASDGTPLIARRGAVREIEPDSGKHDKVYLVDPGAMNEIKDASGNPIDTSAYEVLTNQHALKDWRWAGKDEAGNPIMMKDDMAVHPELKKRLGAMMSDSPIRRWYNEPSSGTASIPRAIAKNLDTAQSVMKREMFGLLAPFHQVQEGTHAIGHTVNPFFGIEDMSKPTAAHQDAMEHGLMLLPEKKSSAGYLEGVGGKGTFLSQAARKFGGKGGRMVADTIDGYQDYLFHQYIPGLKFKTYEHVLERNMQRYASQLKSGEVTVGDVKMLSAEQSNAAYGHLNYALLDRDPLMQHLMQLGLLAPDFLEARARFVGQALRAPVSRAGHEQFRAIATIAMVQAGAAYTLSKLLGDEWDPKHPFELTHNGRTYTMRSVPEDFARLFLSGADVRREFVSGRINPVVQKVDQLRTGRNYRGEQVGAWETMAELLANYIPITARQIPGIRQLTETGRNQTVTPLEQLAGSLGMKISRHSPITKTYQAARDWKEANGMPEDKGSYPVSKYQQLRYSLEDGDLERARSEYQKLIDSGEKRAKISEGFRESILHPFTGSQANDLKFKKSLKPEDRALYDLAVRKRHEILKRYQAMRAVR